MQSLKTLWFYKSGTSTAVLKVNAGSSARVWLTSNIPLKMNYTRVPRYVIVSQEKYGQPDHPV